MARTYSKPPLIEAVCAFTFKSSQPWDLTIPGLVYEQIRANFPVKEQGNIQEMRLEQDERRIITQTAIRFLNEDKTAFVQIAPNLLTMHQLHFYDSWNNFKEQILGNLATYYKVTKSPDLKRVELRYVNRIELSEDAEIEAYFHLLPQIPGPIPQDFHSFLFQIEIPYTAPVSVLKMLFGTLQPSTEANSSYVLDIAMFSPLEHVPDVDHVANWLDIAHERIENVFNASFTEKTHREVFKEKR